jgi:hypothetical protein
MDFQPWSPPQQNSPLQTLSQVLGVKQAQQNLATGAIQQQTAQAGATIATQTATENQNLAKLISDPVGNGIANPDGTPTDQAKNIYMQAAPTTWAEHYSNLVATAARKVEFNQKVNDLASSERGEIANTVAGAAAGAQKPQDVKDALSNLIETKKGTPVYGDYARIGQLVSDQLDHVQDASKGKNPAPAGQEPWRTAALNIGRAALPAASTVGAGGIAAPQQADINTGAVTQQGTRAPALQGGAFTPASQQINQAPPAVTTLPSGSLGVVGGVNGVPGGAPGATAPAPPSKLQPMTRPAPNAPAADQANYQRMIQGAGEEQRAVSQAANDPTNGVQATRFRNQQILDLIPHATTGPGTKILNTLASRLPGASGDAYQDLEHYTAQNSAALAKQMGVPGTNLGAETAAAAAGNVERNPGALKEITKTNDALNTAFDLYNRGLAKVTNNGSDLSRAASYKQAFGQNLDINAVRWADAHRRGDAEEIQQLQKKLGPQGIADATQKLNTLKSLAVNGDLP